MLRRSGAIVTVALVLSLAGMLGVARPVSAVTSINAPAASVELAWAWGDNTYGDLGNGTTTNSTTAAAVSMPAGVTFSAISAGELHSLGIDASGHAWAWGYNTYGQLGNGTTTNSTTPVAVSMPAGVTFTAISAGSYDSLALDAGGHAWAWGDNGSGELGNGTTTNSTTPVAVSMPAGVTFTAIAATEDNEDSLALDTSGRAWAWGNNADHELGNGNTTNSSTPVPVSMPAGVTFVAIAAGGGFGLGLDATGRAWAWGFNGNGELGNGGTSEGSTPEAVSMPAGVTFSAIAAGASYSLALDASGHAWAWGDNTFGQLGNGGTTGSTTPVAASMPAATTFSVVAAGLYHSLALDGSGHAWAWGDNGSGELGNGATSNSSSPTAVGMPAGARFVAIAGGFADSLALAVASTATTVTSSSNPSSVGQAVTYTATVAPTPDGGTMAFTDNGTTLTGCGAVTVNTSTGKATCPTSYSAAGSHSIVASYSGNANYATSNGTTTQQVNAAATTTTVSGSPNPSTVGQSVTYTATVSPTPDGGTLAFTDNSTPITGCGAVAVDASTGKATCSVTYSSSGSHTIVASYSGDANYVASNGSLIQHVNQPSPTITALTPASGPVAGGQTVTVTGTDFGTDTTATFGGSPISITNLTPESFTVATPSSAPSGGTVQVQATDALGASVEDAASTYTYLGLSNYTSVPPFRILDTRSGTCIQCSTNPTFGPGVTEKLQLTGVTGLSVSDPIPTNATAVVLNVTEVEGTANSLLTVYPFGSSLRPVVSNLNFPPDKVIANLVTVTLGTGGAVSIYNALGSVNVVVDVEGYFTPQPATNHQGLFHPISPVRVCDTRTSCEGHVAVGAGKSIVVTVATAGGIPRDGTAGAAVVNLTGVAGSASTYLSLFPTDSNGNCIPTGTSTINLLPGAVAANRVMVQLGPTSTGGPDDALCVYNAVGSINVIVDANGWYGSATAGASPTGYQYQALAPIRICDTRSASTSCSTGAIVAGTTLQRLLTVAGHAGVPAFGSPTTVVAIIANLTGVAPTAATYLALYPANLSSPPGVSDLNLGAGTVVPNLAVVEVDTVASNAHDGDIYLYNGAGSVNAILDLEGWFQ